MGEGGEEGVCVWGKVDAGGVGFEVQDGADEGGILMGEAVVFLSGPGTCFDVVDAADVFAPGSLTSLLLSVY